MQSATDDTHLGGNILLLLGEMFKAIKNLPEYQNQINQFIAETMHFNVHKQILRELINHVPETDSNTLRASDWFMKIIVKSFVRDLGLFVHYLDLEFRNFGLI